MTRGIALGIFTLAAVCLAVPVMAASAGDISFESRTYVPVSGVDGGATHVPLYEYLSIDTEDVIREGLFFRAGGWGRADLADETYNRKTNGDLQYAFLGWRAPVLNAEMRVGRLSLTAGVARNEVFDGLLLGSDLPAGFDVTAYAGMPVEIKQDGTPSGSLFGGRVSQGRQGMYRIGLSFLQEQDSGTTIRQEAGTDLLLTPVPMLEITGTSFYNASDSQWARHDYRLTVGPFLGRVRVIGTWAQTDYNHFFTDPKNPALTPLLNEKLNRTGGELEVGLGWGFTLGGGYTAYRYDVAGPADVYTARLGWANKLTSAGLGFRQVHGDDVENRYREATLNVSTKVGPVRLFGGAQRLEFDEAINGVNNSTMGSLGLAYAMGPALEITASGEYGQNPEFSQQFKGLLAVTWRYDVAAPKEKETEKEKDTEKEGDK